MRVKKIRESSDHKKYKRRKRWFWLIFTFILLMAVSAVLFPKCLTQKQEKAKLIRVGICGAVHIPAVYDMLKGSDLSQLILRANGAREDANLLQVDFNKILQHDTIYHIPSLGLPKGGASLKQSIDQKISELNSIRHDTVSLNYREPPLKCITMLYVGFPAVYVMLYYYPDLKRVDAVHLPHSTLFLDNKYRLIDIFFTLGIRPTVDILERILAQKIDYYMIHDRFSYIDFVDALGGIDITIDEPYAEFYKLKAGPTHLDGFYTWEYIRFLDFKHIDRKFDKDRSHANSATQDNWTMKSNDLELAYELRQYRQRNALNQLRAAFKKADVDTKLELVTNLVKTLQTNAEQFLAATLYREFMQVPNFTYSTLPGYYSKIEGELYYYPDIPNFELLRKSEVRKNLVNRKSDKKQTVY